jgi:hypothetical protein
MMDNAVMQSQGNLLSDVNYFQRQWSHVRTTTGGQIKNLINYIRSMSMEYKVNMRLDMLVRDGSRRHIHLINYFTKYRDEIFQYAIFKSDKKPSSIKESTISHLHSFLGMRGYIKGIGVMPAIAKTSACKKGHAHGIGAMSAKARIEASSKGKSYENIGIKWEKMYADFEGCVVMPVVGTIIHNWKQKQLIKGKELVVWMRRFRRRLQRIKRVPCGVIGNRDYGLHCANAQ